MKAFMRSLTHPAVASALVALALTGLLYGDALALPLFSDDLVQIPWLESLSWRELWTSPSPYGYYRPLWYTLWRLWGMLLGGFHPAGLHLLNLIAHFAAAWLTGLLAATWTHTASARGGQAISGALATALFAVFPFSRQAIAWPGALYNPVVSGMAAGALLAYDRGRQGHGTRWIGLALLLAALAPFNYESGMLVGPLVVLVEGLGWLQRRWKNRSWWALAFIGLFLIMFAIWRAMRGTGVIGFGLNPTDLWRNAGYLVQGLIYPTAPLAQCLAAWLGLAPELAREFGSELALWLVALPTLALLTWSALRWNRDAFWLGAGWFALFALPPAISMKADWFALAPRFLYMTATGVSLMWTAAVSAWLARPRPSWRAALTVIVLAALLAPAVVFVRDGIRLYRMAGESIWDAAKAATRKQPSLFVNLPKRITPHGRVYPLGFEGITPLPTRITAEELVYVHTGIHDAAEAVAFGIVATDQPAGYDYELFGQVVGWEELADAARQTRTVYLARYETERIHLVEAGSVGEAVLLGKPLARFEDRVTLLDATCTCDETGQVYLTVYWQTEANVKTDVTVFAHLLGPDDALVTQADGYPLLGMLPFWLWNPGEAVRDVRHFDPVPAGEYTVRLGLWELATGKQWLADGYLDGVLILSVHCP
jgi:hypothetical protein